VPLGRFPERLAELDPSRPWVTMCRGGSRSAIAASLLQQAGISHAMNLEGGLAAWVNEGLPTAKEVSEWATSR
jgi:hydroxyacylglutathione hydrolase